MARPISVKKEAITYMRRPGGAHLCIGGFRDQTRSAGLWAGTVVVRTFRSAERRAALQVREGRSAVVVRTFRSARFGSYSCLSATSGSMRAARADGISAAATLVRSTSRVTAAKVAGSVGSIS